MASASKVVSILNIEAGSTVLPQNAENDLPDYKLS